MPALTLLPAPSATQPINVLYAKHELIGRGAYGSVFRGVHLPTGTVVALKIIDLDTADGGEDVVDIQKEVALLGEMRETEARNVTAYYGAWLEGPRVWIVMDYAAGGSVRTLVSRLNDIRSA